MAASKAKKLKVVAAKKVSGVGTKTRRSSRKKAVEISDANCDFELDVDMVRGLQQGTEGQGGGGGDDRNNASLDAFASSAIAQSTRSVDDLEKEIDSMKAALVKERVNNAQLQRRIEKMAVTGNQDDTGGQDAGSKTVLRPCGTAGTQFSIQESMGLAGSKQKHEIYKALQRNLRDLTMNARINWEVPWAQVPARDKAKLFEVARDQHPFLARFERDWATEEIVKQFVKNKRKNHYANGWLDVPEKYNYLRQNSRKRNPAGSRSKKALNCKVSDVAVDNGRQSRIEASTSRSMTGTLA